jgi:hypothetical protein
MESFAYGADRYTTVPTARTVTLTSLRYRFGLGDAVGASSAVFAEECHKQLITHTGKDNPFVELIPTYPYSSPIDLEKGDGGSAPYPLADGGSMENTGVVALLRHGVDRVAAFVSCGTPISRDSKTGQVVVDAQLPPLFGMQPHVSGAAYRSYRDPLLDPTFADFRHNRVFPEDRFDGLLKALGDAADSGEGAVCLQELDVVPNPYQGVAPRKGVRVLWVYNQASSEWRDQLSEGVRTALDSDAKFASFPNFPTQELSLTSRQVNLLANLTCWKVMSGSPGFAGPKYAGQFRALFQDT